MYSVEFTDFARKQLLKLPEDVQARIVNSLERIRIRPFSFVKRLVGMEAYSLRVGNYRVLLDIFEDKLLIVVIELGHRRNIYK